LLEAHGYQDKFWNKFENDLKIENTVLRK